MKDIIIKFLGEEYSVPRDVLTYISLLDFTDSISNQLKNAFMKKLNDEITKNSIGIISDEDLLPELEQQTGKYIGKLCDNDIYCRTISDYLTVMK